MKRIEAICAAVLATVALAPAAAARADCKLLQTAEFHVDPQSERPIVDGQINGQPARIMFDTGASTSIVVLSEAKRLNLVMSGRHGGERMYGIGGDTAVYDTNIRELQIGAFKAANLNMIVAGDPHDKSDVTLILGDDFFSRSDVEFDLREGVVRMFEPHGCTPSQLVYWGQAYSQATILPWDRDGPKTQTMAIVNGRPILAEFDSGASFTAIDRNAAEAAGAPPPQGEAVGVTHGIGPRPVQDWVGHFDSLAVGDEKLSNVRLRVMSFAAGMAQAETGSVIPYRLESTPYLYIGVDFFHAHRIFFDNKDHLILFSYEGGPVFRAAETSAAQ